MVDYIYIYTYIHRVNIKHFNTEMVLKSPTQGLLQHTHIYIYIYGWMDG